MRTCDFLCMHARLFVYACVCLCLSESLLFGARVHLASASCLYCDYVCLFCSGVSYPITLTMRTAAAQLSTDYAAFTAEAVADVPLDDLRRALDESDDSDDGEGESGSSDGEVDFSDDDDDDDNAEADDLILSAAAAAQDYGPVEGDDGCGADEDMCDY